MKNIYKGILIGIGKIIPGVSGSLIAISLGVYEESLNIIGNIITMKKKELNFLLTLGIGILFSIIFLSNIIIYLLNNYYMQIMFTFIGLITGCLNGLIKYAKGKINMLNFLLLLLPLIFFLLIYNMKIKYFIKINYFSIFILGILEAISMIIPGISGTALFIYLGVYNKILKIISSLSISLIIFGSGIIVGFIILSKILSKLIKKYKYEVIYIIIGFTIATILIILKEVLNYKYKVFELIISMFLFVIGYIFTMNYNI